jgi:hypothetical protein
MHRVSHFARHLLAVVGAFAITASLMVGSFATGPQVQSIAGGMA